jgi:hypothetical protein
MKGDLNIWRDLSFYFAEQLKQLINYVAFQKKKEEYNLLFEQYKNFVA